LPQDVSGLYSKKWILVVVVEKGQIYKLGGLLEKAQHFPRLATFRLAAGTLLVVLAAI
jgi:hypothetical protein